MNARITALVLPAAALFVMASMASIRPSIDPDSPGRVSRPVTQAVAPVTPSIAQQESPIDPFDRCIQDRFHEVDMARFGLSRLPHHFHWYEPETSAEHAAVASLQATGLTLRFHVGSLRLLDPVVPESEWERTPQYGNHRVVSDPIQVTGARNDTDAPPPWVLWEHGQRALVQSHE